MSFNAVFMKVIFFYIVVISIFNNNIAVDVRPQEEKYEPDYLIYHNLSQMIQDVTALVQKYEGYIIKSDEYKSKAGQTQLFIRISNFTVQRSNASKVKVLFAYGEHAREFFPMESLYYLLKNITGGLDSTTSDGGHSRNFSAWMLDHFELYIIGIANPDGRSYVEQTRNYCWRGTGTGVDLNRNFDWNFGGVGSSDDPNDGEYKGPYAFSEPETEIFKRLISSVSFDAFVSFHSGVRHIYIPFADTFSKQQQRVPENRYHIIRLAEQMSKSCPTRPFRFGLAYELSQYTADGTSYDYMAGFAKIPFSFAIELWEHEHHTGRSCFDEFNPMSKHVATEAALLYPLYVEFFTYLYKWKQGQMDKRETEGAVNLIRRKKDDSYLKMLQRNDILFVTVPSQKDDSSPTFHSPLMFVLIPVLGIVCLVLMARHIYCLMKKKRIVSLRSLSSTFSLFKTL